MDSVFFLQLRRRRRSLDHVPPVPKHTNDFTDKSLGITTDISSIAVNPDTNPASWPASGGLQRPRLSALRFASGLAGLCSGDDGQRAGLRCPARLPLTQYDHFAVHPQALRLAHTMDHTAILKFVESRFILPTAHLTNAMPRNPTCWSSSTSPTFPGPRRRLRRLRLPIPVRPVIRAHWAQRSEHLVKTSGGRPSPPPTFVRPTIYKLNAVSACRLARSSESRSQRQPPAPLFHPPQPKC